MKTGFFCLLFAAFFACSGPESNQTSDDTSYEATNMTPEEAMRDSLFSAMMAVHDEVMPKMDRMYRLRRQATELADSLSAQSDAPVAPDTLRAIAQRVEEAEEAMMNWMRSNDFEFDGMSHEEIMQELKAEKENIIVVKEKMLNSIEEAEAALNQFDEQ